MKIFVRFHEIEFEIELPQQLRGKFIGRVLYEDKCTQTASLLFLIMYILCIKFSAIPSARNRDQLIRKTLKKTVTTAPPFERFSLNHNCVNLCYDITKYKI